MRCQILCRRRDQVESSAQWGSGALLLAERRRLETSLPSSLRGRLGNWPCLFVCVFVSQPQSLEVLMRRIWWHFVARLSVYHVQSVVETRCRRSQAIGHCKNSTPTEKGFMLQTMEYATDTADVLKRMHLVCDALRRWMSFECEGHHGKMGQIGCDGTAGHGTWQQYHFCKRTFHSPLRGVVRLICRRQKLGSLDQQEKSKLFSIPCGSCKLQRQ